MKFDDSDSMRVRPSLSAKRGTKPANPTEKVEAKYSAGFESDYPVFDSGGRDGNQKYSTDRKSFQAPDRTDDIAEFHGLDRKDIPATVSCAMENMLSEITCLRAALEQAQNRIAFLEGLGDRDPVAGCLTAPALQRQLARVLHLDQQSGTHSHLAMLTIRNWQSIHHGMNRKADETVLSHLGRLLRDSVRTGDVVGHTADDAFALIFVASAWDETRELIAEIDRKISETPVDWAGGILKIELLWASLSLAGRSDADDVLAAADKIMRDAIRHGENRIRQ